jgi:hypothetical protein
MATVKKSKKNDPSYRRKSNSKYIPAERFLRFQVEHVPGAGATGERSHFLDIAANLSKLNRRLYRQGKVYRIQSISITSRNSVNGLVSFSTASDSWVVRNAWNRGFEFYELMNKKVLDMPGQSKRKGRWHDYKVYLTEDHRSSAAAYKPGARDNGNNLALNGEWIYSKYQSPDGASGNDEYTAHLLGDHTAGGGGDDSYASISLVKSYAESRGTVANTPSLDNDGDDDPLLNLFDYGTEIDEIAANLDDDNDLPPYGWSATAANQGDYYPGSNGNVPKPIVRRLAGVGQQGGNSAPTVMLPGFDAMCGLIEIETQSQNAAGENVPDTFDVIIELAPGGYKGVAAFDI